MLQPWQRSLKMIKNCDVDRADIFVIMDDTWDIYFFSALHCKTIDTNFAVSCFETYKSMALDLGRKEILLLALPYASCNISRPSGSCHFKFLSNESVAFCTQKAICINTVLHSQT